VFVAKAGGQVSAIEAAVFNEVIALSQNNPKANYYLAAYAEQQAQTAEAKRAPWETLIARFEQENPSWLNAARDRLVALGGEVSGGAPVAAGQSGPTQADIDAASGMSDDERTQMIQSMVDGLAAKLQENPADAEGWLRLIRARMVMQNQAQATIDLEAARKQFSEASPERAALEALAKEFNL
jgi:cytochrome c-type biogenesis protein CcmH